LDLEPDSGQDAHNVSLDKMIVEVKGGRFWLDAAGEPKYTILYIRLCSARKTLPLSCFLRTNQEPRGRDAGFLVDIAPCLQADLFEFGFHIDTTRSVNGIRLYLSFEKQ
jgi:transposase-like protein